MNFEFKMEDTTTSIYNAQDIAKAVWDKIISEESKEFVFGELVKKYLITVAKFIGLK